MNNFVLLKYHRNPPTYSRVPNRTDGILLVLGSFFLLHFFHLMNKKVPPKNILFFHKLQKRFPASIKFIQISCCNRNSRVVVHYWEKLMGVVVFAKVQEQVKFASPRTWRVRGLSDFASPWTYVKITTPINSLQ